MTDQEQGSTGVLAQGARCLMAVLFILAAVFCIAARDPFLSAVCGAFAGAFAHAFYSARNLTVYL